MFHCECIDASATVASVSEQHEKNLRTVYSPGCSEGGKVSVYEEKSFHETKLSFPYILLLLKLVSFLIG